MTVTAGYLCTYVAGNLLDTPYAPVTSISGASTNAQIPTAKGVYDYLSGIGHDPASIAAGSAAAMSIDGSQVITVDAGLVSVAGLTTSADKMIYTTASDTYAVTDLTSFARTLLDDANQAAALGTLNAVSGRSNLTTEYRGVFVNAAGEVTESSSIVTDASGNLGVGMTPVFRVDIAGADGNGVRYSGVSGVKSFFGLSSTDGQFGTVSNHGFQLLTNSSVKATLTSAGALLINATAPVGTEKLHVAGSQYIVGSGRSLTLDSGSATGAYIRIDTNGVAIADIGAGDQVFSGSASDFGLNVRTGNMDFGSGGTRAIRINTSQQVLVNATAPVGSEKLHVAGDQYNTGESFRPNNKGIFFESVATANDLGIKSNTSDAMTFRTGGAWDRMTLTSAGALLIGATAPVGSELLYADGDAWFNGDIVSGVPATGGKLTLLGKSGTSNNLTLTTEAGNPSLQLASSSDRFLVLQNTSTGHFGVLINATAPVGSELLHVDGSVYVTDFYDCATAKGLKVAGTQVVTNQGAAVADATDAASVITQLNTLLARCRAHGLIAT